VYRRSVDSQQDSNSYSTLDGIIDFGLVAEMCEKRTGDKFVRDPMLSTFENLDCQDRKKVVDYATFGASDPPNYNGSPYTFSARLPSKAVVEPLVNKPTIQQIYKDLGADMDVCCNSSFEDLGKVKFTCDLSFGCILRKLNIPDIPPHPDGVIQGQGKDWDSAKDDAIELLSSLFDYYGVYNAYYYRNVYKVISDFSVDILVKAYLVGKAIGKKFWSTQLPYSWDTATDMLSEMRDGKEYVVVDVYGKTTNLLMRNYAKEFVADFISDHVPYYVSFSYVTNYPLYLLAGAFRCDGPNLLGKYCFGDYRSLVKKYADGSPLLVCDKYHGLMWFMWVDYFSKEYDRCYNVVSSMDRLDKTKSGFRSSFALGRRLYEAYIYQRNPGITEDIHMGSYMDGLYALLRSNSFHNCWSSSDDKAPKKSWCESFLALVGGSYRCNPDFSNRICEFFYVKPNYTEKAIGAESVLSHSLSRVTGKRWSYRRNPSSVKFIDGINSVEMSKNEMECYIAKLVNPQLVSRDSMDDDDDDYDAIDPTILYPSIWSFGGKVEEEEES
jgi:hypothetical protein